MSMRTQSLDTRSEVSPAPLVACTDTQSVVPCSGSADRVWLMTSPAVPLIDSIGTASSGEMSQVSLPLPMQ